MFRIKYDNINFTKYQKVLRRRFGEVIVKNKISKNWEKMLECHSDTQKLIGTKITKDKLVSTVINIMGNGAYCNPLLIIMLNDELQLKITTKSIETNFKIKMPFQIQASIIISAIIIDEFFSLFPKLSINIEEDTLCGDTLYRIDMVVRLNNKIKIGIEFNEKLHDKEQDFNKMRDIFSFHKMKLLQFYENDTDIGKFTQSIIDMMIIQADESFTKKYFFDFYEDNEYSYIKELHSLHNKFLKYDYYLYNHEIFMNFGRDTISSNILTKSSNKKRKFESIGVSESDSDYDSELDDNINYDRHDSSSDYEP